MTSMSMTEHDLRYAQQAIEEWSKLLLKGDQWTPLAEPVMSVKLCNPEHGEYIGDLILEDGWVGFEPRPAAEPKNYLDIHKS